MMKLHYKIKYKSPNSWQKFFAHCVSFSRTETEQYIEPARAALGDKAYIAAFESGKRMNLDEAVAYALKELQ